MWKLLLLSVTVFISACSNSKKINTPGDKWISLFNGENLDGWVVKAQHHETGVNVGNTFRAEDGIIKVRYDQYDNYNDQFAHLFYNEPLSRYHLKLDYRLTGTQQKELLIIHC